MMNRLREANIGTIKNRERDALAKKALPHIRTFFRNQRTIFFKRFSDYKSFFPESGRPSLTALSLRLIEADRQMTLADFDRVWNGVEAETTDQLQVLIYTEESKAMEAGAEIGKTFFDPDVGGSFDLDNPRAVNWFAEHGGSAQYIKGIQTTTKNQIKTIMVHALDEGLTYDETAKLINGRFAEFSLSRARTIAIHEAAAGYEGGNRIFVDGIADMGVVMEKKWQNSLDDDVTPKCELNTADGWIPLNQAHTSGHQNPPRHVRCRCYELYQQKK